MRALTTSSFSMNTSSRSPDYSYLENQSPATNKAIDGWFMMHLIFDIWDFDGNDAITREELFTGLRRFCKAKGIPIHSNLFIATYNEIHSINDRELDRREYTLFLSKFAQAAKVSLSELAFFMVQLLAEKAMLDNLKAAKASTKPSTQLEVILKDVLRGLKDEEVTLLQQSHTLARSA